MICPYCNSQISIGTAYSVPVTAVLKPNTYGQESKVAGVSTAYSCRQDECKQQLRKAHGVKSL